MASNRRNVGSRSEEQEPNDPRIEEENPFDELPMHDPEQERNAMRRYLEAGREEIVNHAVQFLYFVCFISSKYRLSLSCPYLSQRNR